MLWLEVLALYTVSHQTCEVYAAHVIYPRHTFPEVSVQQPNTGKLTTKHSTQFTVHTNNRITNKKNKKVYTCQ